MEEECHHRPSKRPRRTDVDKDVEDDDDVEDDTELNLFASLPDETILNIMAYLDVRTLVEIKPLSRQWQILSTQAIDAKGIGTTRKVFKTNQELKESVKRYCPVPQGDIDEITTTQQQYCDRETAEDIACTYGWPINKWDVSQVEDFSNIFRGGVEEYNAEIDGFVPVDGINVFDEDISAWDVSKAQTMEGMFKWATKFNHDLSTWDVSNVTTMMRMFSHAELFNQDMSTWNVSNVKNMDSMFYDAKQFSQDISTWDVSNVTIMHSMFSCADHFNNDISSWNVSNVISMKGMFCYAGQFNQNISGWDVSNVTDMSRHLFLGAVQMHANYDLSSWEGWDFAV